MKKEEKKPSLAMEGIQSRPARGKENAKGKGNEKFPLEYNACM